MGGTNSNLQSTVKRGAVIYVLLKELSTLYRLIVDVLKSNSKEQVFELLNFVCYKDNRPIEWVWKIWGGGIVGLW